MTHQQLTRLTDKRLLARTQKLANVERRVTISMLAHLNEVERRRLHFKLGYGSLFDYCTEHLGYSAPAAGRRIQSARCMRTYPRVYEMLKSNQVNLTTIATVAGVLTKENSNELLARIRNKSKREVEAIKAEYAGPVMVRDRMKTVCIAVREGTPSPLEKNKPTLAGESESGLTLVSADTRGCRAENKLGERGVATLAGDSDSRDGSSDTRTDDTGDTKEQCSRLTIRKRLVVEFSAAPGFMEKFEEVRGLLTHRFAGRPSFEQVFDVVMDLFLDRYSPVRRQRRREGRARQRVDTKAGRAGPSAQDNNRVQNHSASIAGKKKNTKALPPPRITAPHSRQREWNNRRQPIPAAVRDEVYARNGGKCGYVGTDGRRCNSTLCVQVDHIVPVARGGTNEPSNLRLLCALHNRLEAERVFGATWMNKGDPVN